MYPPEDAQHVVLIAGEAVALADRFGNLVQMLSRDREADDGLAGETGKRSALLDPLPNRHD
jgi:hypothetical protein